MKQAVVNHGLPRLDSTPDVDGLGGGGGLISYFEIDWLILQELKQSYLFCREKLKTIVSSGNLRAKNFSISRRSIMQQYKPDCRKGYYSRLQAKLRTRLYGEIHPALPGRDVLTKSNSHDQTLVKINLGLHGKLVLNRLYRILFYFTGEISPLTPPNRDAFLKVPRIRGCNTLSLTLRPISVTNFCSKLNFISPS